MRKHKRQFQKKLINLFQAIAQITCAESSTNPHSQEIKNFVKIQNGFSFTLILTQSLLITKYLFKI